MKTINLIRLSFACLGILPACKKHTALPVQPPPVPLWDSNIVVVLPSAPPLPDSNVVYKGIMTQINDCTGSGGPHEFPHSCAVTYNRNDGTIIFPYLGISVKTTFRVKTDGVYHALSGNNSGQYEVRGDSLFANVSHTGGMCVDIVKFRGIKQ